MLSRFFLHHKTAWLSSAYFFFFLVDFNTQRSMSSSDENDSRWFFHFSLVLPPFLVLLRPTCSMAYAVPSLFGFLIIACLLINSFFSLYFVFSFLFFFRRFDSHFGIVFLHCSCAGISSSFFYVFLFHDYVFEAPFLGSSGVSELTLFFTKSLTSIQHSSEASLSAKFRVHQQISRASSSWLRNCRPHKKAIWWQFTEWLDEILLCNLWKSMGLSSPLFFFFIHFFFDEKKS